MTSQISPFRRHSLLALSLFGSLFLPSAMLSAVTLQDLGAFPNMVSEFSSGFGVSADGSVVVGSSISDLGLEPFRWTGATGLVSVGNLPGAQVSGQAFGVSSDGSVVVGQSNGADGLEAFRWTSAGGIVGLGDLPGGKFQSRAYRVSADGMVIVGRANNADGAEPFRWTSDGGMEGLGTLSSETPTIGDTSEAFGVSADGSVIVGVTQTGSEALAAFRWTSATGMVSIGFLLGGTYSAATDVSADGSMIVGQGNNGTKTEAFRWTSAGGMVGLGFVPGADGYSAASAVSGDGSRIVGVVAGTTGAGQAMVWDAENGIQTLSSVLTAAGVDLTGWTLEFATDVSADGTAITGTSTHNGKSRAFLVTGLPAAAPPTPTVTTPPTVIQNLSGDAAYAKKLGALVKKLKAAKKISDPALRAKKIKALKKQLKKLKQSKGG